MVVDNVGGEMTRQSLRALAWGGRLTIVGFAGGEIPEIPANRLLLKNASAMGVMWGGYQRNQPADVQPTHDAIFALLDAGTISPVISATYPLSEAPRALIDLDNRNTVGKVVLITEQPGE